MKTTITLALILLCTLSFAQPTMTLEGFFGIPFGSSKESAKKQLIAKGCKIDNTFQTDPNMMVATEGTFAGHSFYFMILRFTPSNLFCIGTVVIKPRTPARVFELYEEICSGINQKYYPCNAVTEDYTYPYAKGDGNTDTAIKVGKASFMSLWEFQNTNLIVVKINDELQVSVTYRDEILFNHIRKQQKTSQLKDL